jgi:hypothetical protein
VSTTYILGLTVALLVACLQEPFDKAFAAPAATKGAEGVGRYNDHSDIGSVIKPHETISYLDLIALSDRCGDDCLSAPGD